MAIATAPPQEDVSQELRPGEPGQIGQRRGLLFRDTLAPA
jgi:hypothetical protein